MATWADVERVVAGLPEAEESTSYRHRAWKVRGATFAWDRPFSKRDLRDLGDDVPDGPVLAVRVDDLGEKDAILATAGPWFSIPHLEGCPAVLVRLQEATAEQVGELVVDAWRAMAPAALVSQLPG
jgi:hypothetical protein